jgi:hypothetical protein
VRHFLRIHRESGSFLECPAVGLMTVAAPPPPGGRRPTGPRAKPRAP